MSGTGTGAGKGTRTRMGMGTIIKMGARTGAGMVTKVERTGEGRREPGNLRSGNREMHRKTRERGRRQRVTSSQSGKTQRPSETVAS